MVKMMIHPSIKDAFRQFSRNGRWGTCGACPRDSDGAVYPESCENTNCCDHQLTIESLVEQHKIRLKVGY